MVYTLDELYDRIAPIAKKYRLKAVYVFGSYARGEANENSDIDLLIDTTGTNLKSLLHLASVYSDLEDALQPEIDLITVSSIEQQVMMPSEIRFREAVLRERVSIYAAA